MLEDETILIDDSFYVIGRIDKSNWSGRKTVEGLVNNLDKSKYIIVLDHQPVEYLDIEENKVDLHIAGHTHGGQIFPIDIINEMTGLNDMLYGIKKTNNTTFIVSSGISMWGFPIRTSHHSEYVIINITK